MLNHRNTQIVFLLLMAVLVFIAWKYGVSFYWFLLLLFSFISITFFGSNYIQANYFTKSYNHGNTDKKSIALTFDDGPMKDYTSKVLDILKTEGVSAAFFLIGRNIEGNEPLLKRMNDEGHVVGNHSFSHNFWFSMKSSKEMVTDLKQCDETIEKVIGKRVKLFRPPYGVTNPMVAKAIKKGNYTSIGWSLRTYDTTAKDRHQLLSKMLNNVKNGDVILLHDWGQHTIGILSEFISEVRKRGFEIVRPDELLGVKAYA